MKLFHINSIIAKISDTYPAQTFVLFKHEDHYYTSGRQADNLKEAGEETGVNVGFFPAPCWTVAKVKASDFEKVLSYIITKHKGKIVITDKHNEALKEA